MKNVLTYLNDIESYYTKEYYKSNDNNIKNKNGIFDYAKILNNISNIN